MGEVGVRAERGGTPAGVISGARSRRTERFRYRRSTAVAIVCLLGASLLIGRGVTDAAAADTVTISDSFNRTVSRGWGSAEAGGRYTYGDTGAYSVNGKNGVIKLPAAGQSRTAKLPTSSTNQTATVSLGVTSLPTSGNGVSIALLSRDGGGKAYRAALRIAPGGKTSIDLVRIDGSASSLTTLKSVALPYTATANSLINLELTTSGTSNVDITARAWPQSTTAPTSQITYRDSSDKRITTAGLTGIWAYTSGSSQAATILVDNLKVTTPSTTTTTATSAPTTTRTTTPTTTTTRTTTPTTAATTRSTTSPSASQSSSAAASATSGFPGASNTGVPAGTTLSTYTGPCTIQTANTVIDSKTVNCDIVVLAANITIKNSKVNGLVFVDTDRTGGTGWSVTVQDSEVDGGHQQRATISNGNLTVLRSNVHGGITGVQCDEHSAKCLVQDSWIHGQYMLPGSDWHLGGILSNGTTNFTIRHNTVACDATDGCTGDINFIPNFAPISGALVENNLLKANSNAAYCTYGGEKSTSSYPHSDHIVYRGNVFERGTNSKCAAYGAVTSFNSSGTGNVWQSNTWDNGTTVSPEN